MDAWRLKFETLQSQLPSVVQRVLELNAATLSKQVLSDMNATISEVHGTSPSEIFDTAVTPASVVGTQRTGHHSVPGAPDTANHTIQPTQGTQSRDNAPQSTAPAANNSNKDADAHMAGCDAQGAAPADKDKAATPAPRKAADESSPLMATSARDQKGTGGEQCGSQQPAPALDAAAGEGTDQRGMSQIGSQEKAVVGALKDLKRPRSGAPQGGKGADAYAAADADNTSSPGSSARENADRSNTGEQDESGPARKRAQTEDGEGSAKPARVLSDHWQVGAESADVWVPPGADSSGVKGLKQAVAADRSSIGILATKLSGIRQGEDA